MNGIYQLIPENEARSEYDVYMENCQDGARLSFEFWWYMEETRDPLGINGDRISFGQWLNIRGLGGCGSTRRP